MPMTTASMMIAASTGFGRSEKSGARSEQGQQDGEPGGERGEPRPGAGVVVERARRQARRDGHALEQAGPGVGEALRHRLLVDVDLVAVLGRERAGVAGGLREADQHEGDRGDGPDRRRGPTSAPGRAATKDGRPRGTSPTSATPRSPRSSSHEASRPPTTSTRAPGTLGATTPQPEDDDERDDADHDRRAVRLAQRRRATTTAPAAGCCPTTSVPVSLGSSPMTTSIAAPKRKPVTTARERNCAIQPILSTASSRNSTPDASVIPATNDATSCSSTMPAASTALAATAASPELGPTEICRLRAEDRVEDRAGRRGVEAVLQGDAGDAGIAEVLRDDERGDGDPGDQVATQPAAVVGAQPADDGDPARSRGPTCHPSVVPPVRARGGDSVGTGCALARRLTVPMMAADGTASREFRPGRALGRTRTAPPAGLEPATKRLEGSCSIR